MLETSSFCNFKQSQHTCKVTLTKTVQLFEGKKSISESKSINNLSLKINSNKHTEEVMLIKEHICHELQGLVRKDATTALYVFVNLYLHLIQCLLLNDMLVVFCVKMTKSQVGICVKLQKRLGTFCKGKSVQTAYKLSKQVTNQYKQLIN